MMKMALKIRKHVGLLDFFEKMLQRSKNFAKFIGLMEKKIKSIQHGKKQFFSKREAEAGRRRRVAVGMHGAALDDQRGGCQRTCCGFNWGTHWCGF